MIYLNDGIKNLAVISKENLQHFNWLQILESFINDSEHFFLLVLHNNVKDDFVEDHDAIIRVLFILHQNGQAEVKALSEHVQFGLLNMVDVVRVQVFHNGFLLWQFSISAHKLHVKRLRVRLQRLVIIIVIDISAVTVAVAVRTNHKIIVEVTIAIDSFVIVVVIVENLCR